MMRRSAGLLVALAFLAFQPSVGLAAETSLRVMLDQRPLSGNANDTGAFVHGGITYLDLVKMVKAFNGLIDFGKSGDGSETATVSFPKATATFTIGQATYLVKNGPTLAMPGPALMQNGNFYVPLVALAKLSGLTYARRGRELDLTSPDAGSVSFVSTSAPSATPNPTEDQPSPAQALALVTTSTTDDAGLHMRVAVTNTTQAPYVLSFASGAQIAFVVARNGNDVYSSLEGKRVVQAMTTLRFEPKETKSFVDRWSGFGAAGAGRYTLRVRLMTTPPLDFAPVSVGVSTPGPTPTS